MRRKTEKRTEAIFGPPAHLVTIDEKKANPERYIPPAVQGTVQLLREKGHTVTIRCDRNGSLRYKLDNRSECNAFTLTGRLRKLHGVG